MDSLSSMYPESSNLSDSDMARVLMLPLTTNIRTFDKDLPDDLQQNLTAYLEAVQAHLGSALNLVRIQVEEELAKLARKRVYGTVSINVKKSGEYIQQPIFEFCSSANYRKSTIIHLSSGRRVGMRIENDKFSSGTYQKRLELQQKSLRDIKRWRSLKDLIEGIDERLENINSQTITVIRELNEKLANL